ncbi:MAG: D-2-hydroxyacid dehydrogenase [Ardenticatenaceae bacterium]|nr:D-2-hydroxyacid dehydrogenase [Anaerolineales bacterium]MCB8920245.1 D-2-hydroxyacid dehydrogenase [Ardenticatenaceae bacterium]MCB8991978.1 D-2-hydroxyacid dehydrogenase [Ardenticatenaceae bacterium]MCB9004917.1 D-2-hydroxyacid dehydrogenase [Ardenticatenaceae bacterium]
MTHILLTANFSPHLLDKIRAVSPHITLEYQGLVNGRFPDNISTPAEIIYSTGSIPRPEQAPHLRWIQMHSAGVERLMETAVWHSDILITNSSGIHAPNMAQYILTQILAWAHRIPKWFTTKQGKTWPRNRWDTFLPDELRGRTLGIVGYGSIGRELARLAKPFGMRILASKRDARHPEDNGYTLTGTGDPKGELPDRIYPGEALRSMLLECDYVAITLPATSKTHHLFNEEIFREMKPTSFLINVGRGSVINEKDLVKALKKGWIAGVGLDVFETEPLPDSSPLWEMDNVILTPHVSGFTPLYDERATSLFVENLRRYLAKEPLLNLVHRTLEY